MRGRGRPEGKNGCHPDGERPDELDEMQGPRKTVDPGLGIAGLPVSVWLSVRTTRGSRQRTVKVAILVADCVPFLIVILILSSLPLAVLGTTKEKRAVPLVNDSVCLITLPATDRS